MRRDVRWVVLAASASACVWQLDPPLRSAPDGSLMEVGADTGPTDTGVDIPPTRCSPIGSSRSCYTAPRGTPGQGLCRAGTQSCTSAGVWGACAGEVGPVAEDCNNADDDCNGMVDDVSARPCGGSAASYRLSNSTQPWIDACALAGATVLFPNIDDGVMSVPIGFAFDFFGAPQTLAEVSTNGVVGIPFGVHDYRNAPLPTPSAVGMILPFWDDLVTRTGICVATTGAAPGRQFVVEWRDMFFYNNLAATSHMTFEVVLSERGGLIDVLYQRMDGEGDRGSGASATVGILDSTGVLYDQLGFNSPSIVRAGMGVRWTPANTSGVGACRGGTQTCRAGVWSACPAAVMPTSEVCDGVDNDCDGVVDDGVYRSCYTGPPATQELGICRQGASVCTTGHVFTPCRGEVLPMPTDICGTPFDENCDNTTNDGCM